ncbi:MAG TPA: DUF4328 domain-containing protein [Mycobacteriales bacterium]|nr:DUF4328 domain-containing protein [Mycobacteriales bacterium]
MSGEDQGLPTPGNMPAWNDQRPSGPAGAPSQYGAPGSYGAGPYGSPGPGQPAPGGWPPPPPNLASLSGLATALYVLLPLAMLSSVLLLAALGKQYSVLQDIRDDPSSVSPVDANRADGNVADANVLSLLLLIATGIVFITWFYRARSNAGVLGGRYQRRSQGWAAGAWFCPVVNLWFPYQIATDVLSEAEHAISPQPGPAGADTIPPRRGYGLIRAWWALFIIGNVTALGATGRGGDDVDSLQGAVSFEIVSTVLEIPAAVLAVLVVRRITMAYARL